jgi:hypothetical protein
MTGLKNAHIVTKMLLSLPPIAGVLEAMKEGVMKEKSVEVMIAHE